MGNYSLIGKIHYYKLKAMVKGSGIQNNSYPVVEIHKNGLISITGYDKAISKQLWRQDY